MYDFTARPVATAIAGVRPSEISALGILVPTKHQKHSITQDGNNRIKDELNLLDLKYKYDLDQNVLVGPEFYERAGWVGNGGKNSEDFENYQTKIDDIDADGERDVSKKISSDSGDEENYSKKYFDRKAGFQIEPAVASQDSHVFPPFYARIYNYLPNPQYNFNLPLPMIRQQAHAQKAFDAGLRYPVSSLPFPAQLEGQLYNTNFPPAEQFNRYLLGSLY